MTKPSKRAQQDKIKIVGGWRAIPVDMLRDTELSTQERMLCCLLYSFADHDGACYPLQDSLAALMTTQVRSVQRWMSGLMKHGYVVRKRTIYGNLYELREPGKVLTNTTPGSDPHATPGSPQATPGSHADTTPESHASINKIDHDSDPSTTMPTLHPDDDDGTDDSSRAEETATGKYLRELGINAWKELQTKLREIPHELVRKRVDQLIDQGKSQGIIVTSLRNIPFAPGAMDEAGALPTSRAYWEAHGFTVGDDEDDGYQQTLERGDPDLAAFFREVRV